VANETPAPFAYEGLDRIFHERARLGIVTSLAGRPDGVAFSDLKRLCGLTDGNLARHLQALEEASLVRPDREAGKPRAPTVYRLTDDGRERFVAYLSALENALRNATQAVEPRSDSLPIARPT
jgi:DNA-binding HxlR family transcriptional regulator